MNPFTLKYFGFFFLIISFFSFFSITYSYYFNLLSNLSNYILIFVITLFLGLFFVFFRKYKFEKINLYERIITVLLGYIILPIAISLPYYLGIENISLINLEKNMELFGNKYIWSGLSKLVSSEIRSITSTLSNKILSKWITLFLIFPPLQ